MLLRCGLSLRKVNLSCHLGLDILTPDNWLENVQNPAAVSVLDDTGKLLSAATDGSGGTAVDAQQLQYTQQLEQVYSRTQTLDDPGTATNDFDGLVNFIVDDGFTLCRSPGCARC